MTPKGERNPSEHLPLFCPPKIFPYHHILLSVAIIRSQSSKPHDFLVMVKFFQHLTDGATRFRARFRMTIR
ncbi:MAG TPA: hypothetical protein VK568_04440 [Thermodesulfobacteriota bacterium]|jgi:hypothetical protein|nr:hypothetical protein [Thermodesulfobacteriota bacterium]